MKIEKITFKNNYTTYKTSPNNNLQTYQREANLASELEKLAALNKPTFTAKKYELGLSTEELKLRTSPEHFAKIQFLSPDSPEYLNLAEGDKKALAHLVKAANILGEIELKIDDENNIPFRKYLQKEITKGNKDAVMTMDLFNGMMGAFGKDVLMNNVSLIKGVKQNPGRGVYPRDLTVEEFHQTLTRMLNANKVEEVKKMLNQRSVVVRDGKDLKGIDYIDMYKKEFSDAAKELEKAAKHSTNADFNEYLILQAKAFRKADPVLDAKADIKWATLQDTPLEFTVVRENYDDQMTATIFKNKELMDLLSKHHITPIIKDFIGGRVGIVNKEGTDFLLQSKAFLPYLATLMPYNDEYEQTITKSVKQTMVDVDLVAETGHVGEYRGKITIAENLPNNDKLAIELGGGRRNVYHRQIRAEKQKNLNAYNIILDESQQKYLSKDTYHQFTVGHENAHSLGPKNIDNLGIYRNVIEENKADVAAISFVDALTEKGFYTEDERKALLTHFIVQNFLPAKPGITEAHRCRQVMQCKYFLDNGTYYFMPDGKIHVNLDKVVPTAQKMLKEIIRIQLNDNLKEAEEYVNRNFVWTDDMERISKIFREQNKTINGWLETPLADALAKD